MDEMMLMQGMTDPQKMMFMSQMNTVRKDSTTAVLLAVFLGGLGVHHFYMGRTGYGVAYLLLCWTFLPAIFSLFEAFAMPGRVRTYNNQKAMEIAMQIKVLAGPAPVAAT